MKKKIAITAAIATFSLCAAISVVILTPGKEKDSGDDSLNVVEQSENEAATDEIHEDAANVDKTREIKTTEAAKEKPEADEEEAVTEEIKAADADTEPVAESKPEVKPAAEVKTTSTVKTKPEKTETPKQETTVAATTEATETPKQETTVAATTEATETPTPATTVAATTEKERIWHEPVYETVTKEVPVYKDIEITRTVYCSECWLCGKLMYTQADIEAHSAETTHSNYHSYQYEEGTGEYQTVLWDREIVEEQVLVQEGYWEER